MNKENVFDHAMTQQWNNGTKKRKHTVQVDGFRLNTPECIQKRSCHMLPARGEPDGRLTIPIIPGTATNSRITFLCSKIAITRQY